MSAKIRAYTPIFNRFVSPSTSRETRTRTPNRAPAFEAGVSTIPPHWHRKRHPALSRAASTSGGTRTHTPQRIPDFESGASTNSATEAKEKGERKQTRVTTTRPQCAQPAGTRTPAAPSASPTRVRGHSQPAHPDRPNLLTNTESILAQTPKRHPHTPSAPPMPPHTPA